MEARRHEVEQLSTLSLRGDATVQEYMANLKVRGGVHNCSANRKVRGGATVWPTNLKVGGERLLAHSDAHSCSVAPFFRLATASCLPHPGSPVCLPLLCPPPAPPPLCGSLQTRELSAEDPLLRPLPPLYIPGHVFGAACF